MTTASQERPVPAWVRISYTLFLFFLVPIYYVNYGLLHFLWLSDVALFVTLLALWLNSRHLNSMMATGLLPLELIWNLDFALQGLAGIEIIGLASYMFDEDRSLLLRGLSLFHIPLPIIWIWLVGRWGYDPNALRSQLGLFVAVALATYLLTEPERNINWVFLPQHWEPISWIPASAFVLVYVLGLSLFVIYPMHRLLKRITRPAPHLP